MEIFPQNFLSNAVFGTGLSSYHTFLVINSIIGPIVLCLASWGIYKVFTKTIVGFFKWASLSMAKTPNHLEFKKTKWKALENKQLLRMGANVGFEGVGFEFEHDDRAPPKEDVLKHRLASLRAYYEEDLITEREYSRRKQEILLRI